MKSRSVFLSVTILLFTFLFSACVAVDSNVNTVKPRKVFTISVATNLYPFLADINETKSFFTKTPVKNESKLSAIFTAPAGYKVKLNYNERVIGAYELYKFKNGLYPFTMYQDKKSKEKMSGAIAIVNVDEAIALATFGESEETKLFNPEMIEKAKAGILANGTIAFDDTTVMMYWIGNRKKQCLGQDRNLEVDFSKISNISELKINGKTDKDFVAIVQTDKETLPPPKNIP